MCIVYIIRIIIYIPPYIMIMIIIIDSNGIWYTIIRLLLFMLITLLLLFMFIMFIMILLLLLFIYAILFY